jgi:hypothetical protein
MPPSVREILTLQKFLFARVHPNRIEPYLYRYRQTTPQEQDMQGLGIGAGLAALAFWGFIATAVVAGIWDGIRKREARHETLRRLVESGQPIDKEMMDKLLLMNRGGSSRIDRDFEVTALWILPVAAGVAILGEILGHQVPEARLPILGAAALLACLGVGFLVASKIAGRWYRKESDSVADQLQG